MDETLTKVCFQPHDHASEWYPKGHKSPTLVLVDVSMPQEMAWRIAERYSRWLIRTEPKDDLEETFHSLAKQWRKESSHLSSVTKIVMHPCYQSIIGLGRDVVPILLRQLQQEPDFWFWALSSITRENPISSEDEGNIRRMSNAWLEWGRRQGLL